MNKSPPKNRSKRHEPFTREKDGFEVMVHYAASQIGISMHHKTSQ